MRVAIDAQLVPTGTAGGTEQFVVGLVHALGKLKDASDEYVIITHWQAPDWLMSYSGPNQRIVPGRSTTMKHAVRLLGPLLNPAATIAWRIRQRGAALPSIPELKGFYESLNVQVVHFTFQHFVRCNLPVIYNPHDLQHLHYPQFFPKERLAHREMIQQTGCREAQSVATPSRWAKEDIVQHYSIGPQKVYSIPYGAPTELYDSVTDQRMARVRSKFRLPQPFVLYPAQTWAHKNHLRLLEAIALLRDRDRLLINLVCTGSKNDFWRVIKNQIRELALQNQVQFLGFIASADLRALYRLAQFVILPSLFEGGGLPVLEAFHEGTPLACSNVTSLPEYAGDAALLFDPTSVESIADALRRMATDAQLRAELRERGNARIKLFTWERTAKTYRALYRKVAGVPLSEEDCALLAESNGTDSKAAL